jgi:hypothetical protein
MDVEMWRCGDVVMWRCGDVQRQGRECRGEDVGQAMCVRRQASGIRWILRNSGSKYIQTYKAEIRDWGCGGWSVVAGSGGSGGSGRSRDQFPVHECASLLTFPSSAP